MTSSPSLRIAIIGGGNIGSAFAFQLVLRGLHDVTIIARPGSARLQQLQDDGAIVDIHGQRAGVTVSDRLDEQVPYDVVIVTVMAHQVDMVIPALQRSAAGFILFMFNNFDPERLQTIPSSSRPCCSGCVATFRCVSPSKASRSLVPGAAPAPPGPRQ